MRNNVVPFRKIQWLKSVGASDGKCEKILTSFARRGKKFLIIGEEGSGKNTVANAIVTFMHENGREPVLLPTFSGKNIGDVARIPQFRTFKKILRAKVSVVQPVGYRQNYFLNPYLPSLPELAKGFDVVVDVRRLPDGSRKIAQIFLSRSGKLRCVYRSPEFASLQIGQAA